MHILIAVFFRVLRGELIIGREPYPDCAVGRMAHYRDFVRLAHARGLKVIQDVAGG